MKQLLFSKTGCMGRRHDDEQEVSSREVRWHRKVLVTTKCYMFDHHYSSFIFRADSVTWNPHKLMGTLLQCSTLHVRENVSPHYWINTF